MSSDFDDDAIADFLRRLANEATESRVPSGGRSNASDVGAPDVLVHLELEPHGQAVLEDPRGELFGSRTPCTGENSTAAVRRSGRVASPRHARTRSRRDPGSRTSPRRCGDSRSRFAQWFFADSPLPGHFTSTIRITSAGTSAMLRWPAGFEHHDMAAVEELLHQRIDVRLQQRLAARDLDIWQPMASTCCHHVIHADLAPFVKRVRRVAPRAPEVAGGQPDEHARPAGVSRLALDRVEDLVDGQHGCRPRAARISDCTAAGSRRLSGSGSGMAVGSRRSAFGGRARSAFGRSGVLAFESQELSWIPDHGSRLDRINSMAKPIFYTKPT